MSLTFQIALENPRHTTLDALRVTCSLTNAGRSPVIVPASSDRTGALTFHVRDPKTGTVVRRMNGLSHQIMLSRSRVDLAYSLGQVGAGETVSWTLDLASFHYPLPAGDFEIAATYEYPPSGVSLVSNTVAVSVSRVDIGSVLTQHANPVLDGTAVLFETPGGLHLRQHNHARPLAAWYTRWLDLRANPGSASLVSPNYFNTDTFDHFFSKWVLYEEGTDIVAREHLWGLPAEGVRRAPRPEAGALCKASFLTPSGDIFVFFQSPGVLRGYRFGPNALQHVFEQPLPAGVPEVCVRADEEHVHLLVAHRGLVHLRFLLNNGQPDGRWRVFRSDQIPVHHEYDPTDRLVKAIFRDRAQSPYHTLVLVDQNGLSTRNVKLSVPGTVEEIAFDRSPRGRFIVAASTSRGKLYLFDEQRGPVLLASGEKRFFPRVIARRVTYVGHLRGDRGYRFSTISWRKQGPRVVNYDLAAWEQP
jgi:hypothetical protein